MERCKGIDSGEKIVFLKGEVCSPPSPNDAGDRLTNPVRIYVTIVRDPYLPPFFVDP
jgi:hypothetical protein